MRISKSLYICTAIVSLAFLLGCSHEETKTEPIAPSQSIPVALNYDQYNNLYENLVNNLQFPNYTKIEDQISQPEIVIVDNEVTFGKREVLSVSGTTSDSPQKPTQKRIVYQNSEEDLVLYVNIVYLSQSIGNDMTSWTSPVTGKLKEIPVLNKIQQATLSYKNTLVEVQLISTSDKSIGSEPFNNLLHVLVDSIQKQST